MLVIDQLFATKRSTSNTDSNNQQPTTLRSLVLMGKKKGKKTAQTEATSKVDPEVEEDERDNNEDGKDEDVANDDEGGSESKPKTRGQLIQAHKREQKVRFFRWSWFRNRFVDGFLCLFVRISRRRRVRCFIRSIRTTRRPNNKRWMRSKSWRTS